MVARLIHNLHWLISNILIQWWKEILLDRDVSSVPKRVSINISLPWKVTFCDYLTSAWSDAVFSVSSWKWETFHSTRFIVCLTQVSSPLSQLLTCLLYIVCWYVRVCVHVCVRAHECLYMSQVVKPLWWPQSCVFACICSGCVRKLQTDT